MNDDNQELLILLRYLMGEIKNVLVLRDINAIKLILFDVHKQIEKWLEDLE